MLCRGAEFPEESKQLNTQAGKGKESGVGGWLRVSYAFSG